MTDQTTPAGAPGPPAGNTPAPSNNAAPQPSQFNFMRERGAQLERTMKPAPPAADVQSDARQPQQQTPAAGEHTIDPELAELRAFKAEVDVRRNTLPSGPEKYEARLPADFVLPHGSPRPSFDERNPALAMARQIAHAEGMSQQGFEKLLGVFASTQIPGQVQQQAELQRLRVKRAFLSLAPPRICKSMPSQTG